MRRDVPPDGAVVDLLLVDLALLLVVEEVGHADQLEAPLERLELGHLLEHRQVRLVRRADEELVAEDDGVLHGDLGVLDGAEEILVGLERALQQVGVLDDAAVAVDELARVFVERHRLQRRRQRAERAIHGELPRLRVDGELRLDGDRRLAVAPREVEALDLHVAQHLQVVALVGDEQRLEDLLVLVAEVAEADVVGRRRTACRAASRRGSAAAASTG